MAITLQVHNKWIPGKRFVLSCAFLLCIAVIGFSCFYLCCDTAQLTRWYYGLNDCFYKQAEWATDFFTPRIKHIGNDYCIVAIAVALVGMLYIPRRLQKWPGRAVTTSLTFTIADVLLSTACIVFAMIAWRQGNRIALPAYDEAFSAQNIAGIHPFQTASYYVLPNNHIFFNLLNSVLFHFAGDKITTGRWLSLVAYMAVITLLFWWLKYVLHNRWLAFIAVITIALQFSTWAFSFQARGYELYLLAEWGMIISMFCYLVSPRKKWLLINMLCCAAGYFLIPSFMYVHAAALVFMTVCELVYRRKDIAFWKYQLAGLVITYLLYLPALCFSGLDSILHNRYVAPMADATGKNIWEYLQLIWPVLQYYMAGIFSDIAVAHNRMNYVLCLMPLLLLFDKKNKITRLFGIFYLTMWSMFLIMVVVMHRYPFARNLNGHYSITLVGVILVVYRVIGMLDRHRKMKVAAWVLLPLAMIGFSIHFLRTNGNGLQSSLYGYDVNDTYTALSRGLKFISPGNTLGISDEGFLAGYICMKGGCTVHKCPDGDEGYFVKQADEAMPPMMVNKYLLIKKVSGYEIYKHK